MTQLITGVPFLLFLVVFAASPLGLFVAMAPLSVAESEAPEYMSPTWDEQFFSMFQSPVLLWSLLGTSTLAIVIWKRRR